MNFNGVLPKGTPVAQCIPVKRESWQVSIEALSEDDVVRLHEVANAINREHGVYRHEFRAAKR
jgi:hypothetical protein